MESSRACASEPPSDTDVQAASLPAQATHDDADVMDVDSQLVTQLPTSHPAGGQAHDRNSDKPTRSHDEAPNFNSQPFLHSSVAGPSALAPGATLGRDEALPQGQRGCYLAALSAPSQTFSEPSPSPGDMVWDDDDGGRHPSEQAGPTTTKALIVGTNGAATHSRLDTPPLLGPYPGALSASPAAAAPAAAAAAVAAGAGAAPDGAFTTERAMDMETEESSSDDDLGSEPGEAQGEVRDVAAEGSEAEASFRKGLVVLPGRLLPPPGPCAAPTEALAQGAAGPAATAFADVAGQPLDRRDDGASGEDAAVAGWGPSGSGAGQTQAHASGVRAEGPAFTGSDNSAAAAAAAAAGAGAAHADGGTGTAAGGAAYWYDSDDVYDEPDHAYGMFHEDVYGADADAAADTDGNVIAEEVDAGAAAYSSHHHQHQHQQPPHQYQYRHPQQPDCQRAGHQQQQQQPQPSRYGHAEGYYDFRTRTQCGRPRSGRSGGGAAAAASAAGGSGGAGPSTSRASASAAAFAGLAGASGSGSGGGGLSMPPCPGPELVTADPWSEDEEEEPDTTAEQFYSAAHPKDIQGIPWERLQFNRPTYRDTRLRQYRNYTNLLPDNDGGAYRAELTPLCAAPRRCGTSGLGGGAGAGAVRGPPFFSFVRNFRSVQSNIVHFQLRNLVWATSPNDVFVVHDNCVNHWNPAARTVTEVLNLTGTSGGPARSGGGGGMRVPGLGRVQVSTLCVRGDLVAAGGFMGELVVKRLSGAPSAAAQQPAAPTAAMVPPAHRHAAAAAAAGQAPHGLGSHTMGPAARYLRGGAAGAAVSGAAGGGKAVGGGMQGSLLYCGRITASENGITNGLEIFPDRSHGTVVMAANNDSQLRLFAAAAGEGALRPLAAWPFEWAVNYATVRPDSHLAAVVGDDAATLLTDVHNGATVARLAGHRDFSFAAAWHPGGVLLATGNQDTTTLVWDVRRTDEPLTRLAGRMGAIRSLRFTPDGRFLAMSEPADFVHVYDVASGFQDCQEHDFFGEIAGIAFTPDSSSLFVGISDLTYASLMQLERQRCDWW